MPEAQLSLLGHEPPSLDASFARLRRITLDDACWLDYAPGFVSGHAQLFDHLEAHIAWFEDRRMMYEREVAVPRLLGATSLDQACHPLLPRMAALLGQRYQASFERVTLALYRNGKDSVAFHRDKMARDRRTLVCIVALGTPRRLFVRPFGGGPSQAFQLGHGDLFVMGGMCQQRWEHGIPKVRQAAPRMSMMFRHTY
jgi:alkylated DNA repair dioxygenase AlkB